MYKKPLLLTLLITVLFLAACAKPEAGVGTTKTTTTAPAVETGDVSKEVAEADKVGNELTTGVDTIDEDLALIQNI